MRCIFFVGAFLAGLILYRYCHVFMQSKSHTDARNLLKATVFYLPVLLTLIVIDVQF